MAAKGGAPTQHLKFLQSVATSVRKFGLFPVLRGLEARAQHLPRLGRARRPTQAIVDLAQVPALTYPAPTIEAIELGRSRPEISGYWLGLTGPMGALPIHLTEFAVYERRYAKQRPFGRWLDLLANRMLQFFYRAWADSQPAAQVDRPDDDRFAAYLAALTGATEGVDGRAIFPAQARLHYAALFASGRSAVAIEDALAHLLGQSVRLLEFQPRWRDIELDDQTRLGASFAELGVNAILGGRVRTVTDAFRVIIRARDLQDFETLMPSGARFALAVEALDAFAPSHLDWDIMVEMEERHARPARLDGRTQLGWTGWLCPAGTDRVRSDVHLTRNARARRSAIGGMSI